MKGRIILSLFACFLLGSVAFAQTTIQGTIIGPDGPEISATVTVMKDGNLIDGAVTDFDGNYIITNIDGGTYDVTATYVGRKTVKKTGVVARSGSTTKVDFQLENNTELIEEVVIISYKVPLINFDDTESSTTVTSENIARLGVKSVQAVTAVTSGVATQSGSDDISIRGSRPNATNYYVDGMRVTGLIPVSEIEQMQVITGGLSAEYGDVTGGVISLTSKGPSSKYSGALEVETSEFLDPYGYNFANLSLSGPLIRVKDRNNPEEKVTLLGFRIAGQYLYQKDDRPSAVGVYRMPEDIIDNLNADPVYTIGTAEFPRAELLGKEALSTPLKASPNEDNQDIDLTAKLDLRVSENIDVSVTGVYGTESDRFTPGGGWGLLNYPNNPYELQDNYRVGARWRHKIGKQGLDEESDTEEGRSQTVIRNASYTLNATYETRSSNREDFRNGSNLFEYGQYGIVNRTSDGSVGLILGDPAEWYGAGKICTVPNVVCFDHIGFTEDAGEFIPQVYDRASDAFVDSPNPVLSRYQSQNGRLVGAAADVWGTRYFDNVGNVYNLYRQTQNERTTGTFAAQFDIFPSGKGNQRHNIKFGAIYETRTNRLYNINPQDLWSLARNTANAHFLSGVDTTKMTGDSLTFNINGVDFKFPEYERLIDINDAAKFYESIRNTLGLSLNDYVNIDGGNIDASQLSLDMFSASELNDWVNLGLDYYGYDVYGNKIDGVAFNDFFTERGADGRRTFPVGPIRPNYISGYIQDKFSYKDIILRIGVRAEYFDANTKVAKDPYSLYDILSAEEFALNTGQEIPSSVEGDYKVYVDSDESTNIIAYRKGDQWYNAAGTATEGNLLFQGQVFPAYKNEVNDINDPAFDPDNSFVDYDPTFNLSPRISLSFPISDNAGFFAHYDQKVQRPPSNTTFTALDYYYFETPGRLNPNGAPANNPNLKPEKTVDYEVGFQQKLTDNSALRLSAYYRENRDMIQSRYYQFVSITTGQYLTYGNIDFGTVKGFTIGYDFRRTNNLQFNVNYSLQYAEGTGSSANSGLNTQNGLVRVLIPLSFDERHRIVGNIDYRYEQGDRYNGPRINGVDIFANTGINFQVAAVSGRPYTALNTPSVPFSGTGTQDINGSRLPWTLNVDARLDRNFVLFANPENKRNGINLNVYLRSANLFNTKNIINVYRATGDPENDGYLSSSFGQDNIRTIQNSGKDVQSYFAAHEWASLNPSFYTLPRRIFLGAIVQF